MKICIYRGTHQIGGIATEISTNKTRIVIDMGDELSIDPNFCSKPLNISGVTDNNGKCNAVLFTHYHGDHIGQITRIRDDIPVYAGALAKDILKILTKPPYSNDDNLQKRVDSINTFIPGKKLIIGDIVITPWSIDHSACDSYMFLIEADNKRILYTGDFRLHGIRGKVFSKIIKVIGNVDIVITEGTTITRTNEIVQTEWDLQCQLKEYISKYKYVFLLCSSTNLDRVFALSRAVPIGKYCLCDEIQYSLVKTVVKHWSKISSFYEMPKLNWFKKNPPKKYQDLGGLMFVRANKHFEKIIKQYDPSQSIILYSMWKGYRTKTGSNISNFLTLTDKWETLHTSGHAKAEDIKLVVETLNPKIIIPIHTDNPELMQKLFSNRIVKVLSDNEIYEI